MKYVKKLIAAPLLITVMLVFTACPYESSYQLEGNRIKYEKSLIGSWKGENDDVLTITRNSDLDFSFEYSGDETDMISEATGTGYVVKKADKFFMVLVKDGSTYVICKIENLQSNTLSLIPLDEYDVEDKTFTSADEFSDFVFNEMDFNPNSARLYDRVK